LKDCHAITVFLKTSSALSEHAGLLPAWLYEVQIHDNLETQQYKMPASWYNVVFAPFAPQIP
jgi:hypothetical protein